MRTTPKYLTLPERSLRPAFTPWKTLSVRPLVQRFVLNTQVLDGLLLVLSDERSQKRHNHMPLPGTHSNTALDTQRGLEPQSSGIHPKAKVS